MSLVWSPAVNAELSHFPLGAGRIVGQNPDAKAFRFLLLSVSYGKNATLKNFSAELKRRNVIRMAGLYLVGAWLVVQVAGTVLPMFGAPEWLPRTIVVLLAIGFVPAVIFSWVFELTPQGLKRDEDVAPEQSIAPQTGRRMDRMIIVVLVLALGYFAFDKFVLAPRREAALVASAVPNESKSIINAKSIAVLPFENLSEDKAERILRRWRAGRNPHGPGEDRRLESHQPHFRFAL